MAKKKTSKTKVYLFHELSSYLPLLEGEDFNGLVEDIKQFGQIEPAVLYEGKILDGRNRYRACKQLGIELKIREWNPSESTGMTPLQFVISENIMRRHLNTAQKADIGLLLLEEEEKLAKERQKEQAKLKGKLSKLDDSAKSQKNNLAEKLKELSKGKSVDIVAPKVKVATGTLSQAKKIKQVAETDPEIAKEWEEAKKGETSVGAVYTKVQEKEFVKSLEEKEPEVKKAIEDKVITPKEAKEVITLPKELKNAVIKPKSKLSIKDAKEVAELPKEIITEVAKEKISVDDAKDIADMKPELRKEAIKVVEKQKKDEKRTMDYMKDVSSGKTKPPQKVIDLDMKIINQFAQIYKQTIIKMTRRLVESYNQQTQNRLFKIMKETLIHLQKELNIKGDIIDVT